MAGLLRKLRSAVPAIPDNDDDENFNNTDYSIALEYHGPPVSYDIPKVIPVDIRQIPVAAPVSSASVLNNLSLPVVQPIVKSSNRKSSRIDNSGALACENGYGSESKAKLSDGNESSGTMGFSSIVDDEDDKEGEGFEDYMNPQAESCLSSRAHSSEASSCRQDDGNNEAPRHVKRPSIVTFREPHEESYRSEETSVVSVSPRVARNVKKGVCYRCLKGNRFTEKEVCIVCGAKYCYNCVLRAMGSMPEGRKCVTCIGFRINEKRRGTLGMCSRLLKRLLNDLEVKRIMKAEVLCEVNQIPPALVFVNDEPLSKEGLVELQNCKHPPKNLRPGRYWYDKVSGYWGKEGQKPSQIISPELKVGGNISRKASNGNTNVLINSREITKEELWMLKVAGVTCEGQPHLWVSANGEYQEEGQNPMVGRSKIWDKTRTKMVCAVLSLPVPPDSKSPSGEEANRLIPGNLAQKSLHKLLLVGYDKSGTSTIYKQAKLLYDVPFSEDERQDIKFVIQRNLYTYLGILLEGREQFEKQSLLERRKRRVIDKSGPSATGDTSQIDDTTIYSVGPRVKAFSDWLIQAMVLGNLETIFPAATREYAPFVEQLWNDPAIQATYGRRNELEMLPRAATYFLDRAVEISRTDYEPSDMDILYAEGITSYDTVACMEFLFSKSIRDELVDSTHQHDPSIRFQLLRLHPRSLGANCKWLDMFEDTDILVFCVSLTDYDECSEDFNGVLTNKMLASKQLFESIVTHPAFENKNFLLILNKFDLLEEKIEQVPLTRCEWFHDFNPVTSQNIHNSTNPSLAQRAFHYIAMKFKILFRSHTDNKLFVSRVTGLENDTVDDALRYAREIVLYEEEKPYSFTEISSTDIESCTTT
ncbi:extra-large guanine nucleotide-binding protein 1-like isoform X1 [Corylus avellana]|uniref:extra-large guanine nucleotide-binding protein 1-like isoform X1 n=1 Tax=Corylus avellana TaxID=13451 RepID=UPI00286AE2F5|nr:extra-large guanine nucleotide-binding protein 1-like isoform X1 [Corylus avellana]